MEDWRWLAAAAVTLGWFLPLIRIVKAWRSTSLRATSFWLAGAWAAWLAAAVLAYLAPEMLLPIYYVALAAAACPFVSVLGARRPGTLMWSLFIVGGLAAVLALPLLEQRAASPAWRLDEPRSLFLALILVVALLDYLPTRHGVAAILMVGSLGWLLYGLHFGMQPKLRPGVLLGVHIGVAAAAWLGWVRGHGAGPFTGVDELWLTFRDRYGAVWGLRALEQVNQSAKHADWNIRLTWFGFSLFEAAGKPPGPGEVMAKLQAVLQKFMASGSGG